MAKRNSDRGGTRTLGNGKVAELAHGTAVVEERERRRATVEVGDFISELSTAVRYRERSSLLQGDFVCDAERALTDRRCFGEEVHTTSQVKLRVALCLDTSHSMWGVGGRERDENNVLRSTNDSVMWKAGPAFVALNTSMTMAARDLPEGCFEHALFVFHETSCRIPPTFIRAFDGSYIPNYPHPSQVREAIARGEIPRVRTVQEEREMAARLLTDMDLRRRPKNPRTFAAADVTEEQVVELQEARKMPSSGNAWDYPLAGKETFLTPLFKKVEEWESDRDPDAFHLNLVLTDGRFEDHADVERASAMLERRVGRGATVLLNFIKPELAAKHPAPRGAYQYPVNLKNFGGMLRNAISETISQVA